MKSASLFLKKAFLNKNYILQFHFRSFHSKNKQKACDHGHTKGTACCLWWTRIPCWSALTLHRAGSQGSVWQLRKGDRIFTSLCLRTDRELNTHTVSLHVMHGFITKWGLTRTFNKAQKPHQARARLLNYFCIWRAKQSNKQFLSHFLHSAKLLLPSLHMYSQELYQKKIIHFYLCLYE